MDDSDFEDLEEQTMKTRSECNNDEKCSGSTNEVAGDLKQDESQEELLSEMEMIKKRMAELEQKLKKVFQA